MMEKYLLTYQDNWADEMDVSGTAVLTKEEYTTFKEALPFAYNFFFSVGTNEDIEYETLRNVLNVFTLEPISSDEAETLEKLKLSSLGFGEKFVDAIIYQARKNKGVYDIENPLFFDDLNQVLVKEKIELSDISSLFIELYHNENAKNKEVMDSKVMLSLKDGNDFSINQYLWENFDSFVYEDTKNLPLDGFKQLLEPEVIDFLKNNPHISLFFNNEKITTEDLSFKGFKKSYSLIR